MVAALLSMMLLPDGEVTHTFANEDRFVKDMTMTSTFTSTPQAFNGPLPGKPGTNVSGGRAFAEVKVEYSLEFYGDEIELWSETCGNLCQGPPPVHASHEECDRLCDRPCQAQRHVYEDEEGFGVAGWGLENFKDPFSAGFAEMVKIFTDRGFSINGVGELVSGENKFMEAVNKKGEKSNLTISFSHRGQDPYAPCLAAAHKVYMKKMAGFATITNTYVVEGKNASGQTARLAEVPMGDPKKHQLSIGYYSVNRSETTQEVRCLCSKENTDKKVGYLPGFELEDQWRTFANVGLNASYDDLIGSHTYGDLELNITGQNIFNATATLVGESKGSVFLPAGTRLIPNDPSVQEMTVAEDYTIATYAAIPQGGRKPLPVLCTQMNKRYPTSATKFAVAAPQDGAVQRLAGMSGKGNFRSPLDQVRVWLYTDAPTFDQMAAKLRPMVSLGEFTTALDQVLSGSLPPEKREALESQVTMDGVVDGDVSKNGLIRVLNTEWARDPKKVVVACPDIARGWAADGPKPPGLYARMAHWLAYRGTPEAKAAGYEVLAAVPASFRLRVALEGGLEGVAADIFSSNLGDVERAVILLKEFKAPAYASIIEAGELRLGASTLRQAS